MKKVLGYIRVSTENQATEDKCGIELQKEAIIKYCSKKDYELVGFKVDVISGAKLNRPSLNEILYPDEERDYEAIICFKTDRISRQIEEYYYIKMLLKKDNIEIISTQEDFGEAGMFAPLLESFIVFVAQMERQNIILRTTSGKNVRRRKGGATSVAPYGYTTDENKLLQVNAKEAEMVRDVFRLREQNVSYHKIAQIESGRGYSRTGKDFDQKTIYQIVKNEKFYRGYVEINGKLERGGHTPILF